MMSEQEKRSAFTRETHAHIVAVQERMWSAIAQLEARLALHDASKLEEPEASGFMAMAEELKLSETTYGSDEYRAILKRYEASTIGHHYLVNDHHPEHSEQGIAGMSLLSLLEMVCDWDAAGQRHPDSTFERSLEVNAERFGIDGQLKAILYNTALELGFIT